MQFCYFILLVLNHLYLYAYGSPQMAFFTNKFSPGFENSLSILHFKMTAQFIFFPLLPVLSSVLFLLPSAAHIILLSLLRNCLVKSKVQFCDLFSPARIFLPRQTRFVFSYPMKERYHKFYICGKICWT